MNAVDYIDIIERDSTIKSKLTERNEELKKDNFELNKKVIRLQKRKKIATVSAGAVGVLLGYLLNIIIP